MTEIASANLGHTRITLVDVTRLGLAHRYEIHLASPATGPRRLFTALGIGAARALYETALRKHIAK